MAGLSDLTQEKSSFDFNEIQKRVDALADTKWFQANACYPVCFFYTKSATSTAEFSVDQFLKFHTNINVTKKLKGKELFTSNETDFSAVIKAPKTLTDYLIIETNHLMKTGLAADDEVLRQFSKVSGLKSPTVPLSKNNGALAASKDDSGKDATINLEFLCDRELKTLTYLQAWESKWIHHDFQKKSFLDKADTNDTKGSNDDASGGEGYLGVLNCSIDINGNITPLSHLSLFGLIPKNIELPGELGPQVSSNSLPKIVVKCTYSNAILVYPDRSNKRLNYFYYI